ncbi:unnamed protein product [Malus baccata var. baccata]
MSGKNKAKGKDREKNMIWDTLAFNPNDTRNSYFGVACLQRMSGPSECRFDLNFGEEAVMPSQENKWRSSFLSPTGSLTVEDSVMKNDMIVALVARNLLTKITYYFPNGLMSWLLRILWLSVFSVQEIGWLKHENKQLHRFTHDYATNIKRKLDQLQESDGQILLDHQRFVGLFQRHLLPSSSEAVSRNEAPNDQPSVPPPYGVLPSIEAPNNHSSVPHLSRALPTAETSPEQPL